MNTSSDERAHQLAVAMGRYADGDYRAFEAVYEGLAPLVSHCVRKWQNDPDRVDDLVQETFTRVHLARHRYRPGAPVAPWVLTIARRLCIDMGRRDKTRRDRPSRHADFVESAPDPTVPDGDTEDMLAALRRAVSELPESLRTVVAMHKLEGIPLSEVARQLDIKEGAARVRAHRGYARLKKKLRSVFGRQESGS